MIQLKPGVSPAAFWATIGIGALSTAASALALTSYAWAGMAGTLIALIIGFVSQQRPATPTAQQPTNVIPFPDQTPKP